MDQSHDFIRAGRKMRSMSMRAALIALAIAFLLGISITWYFARGGEFALGNVFQVRSEEGAERWQAQGQDPVTLAAEDLPAPQPTPSASSSPGAAAAAQAVERVEQVVEQI